MLAIVMVALALYILPKNDSYLGDFNITSMLLLVSALGFVGIGQTTVMMTGGIDLSTGPLAGFLVVIASFFINDEAPMTAIVMGLVTMAAVAAFVGLVNSSLIRFVKFTAIAATLTTYIAIGGFAFILRPEPDGYISVAFADILNAAIGPIPYVFIAVALAAVGMEILLRKTRWGWQLRAVGSNEEYARKVGVKVTRSILGAYVIASLFVFLGSVLLAVQLGIGDLHTDRHYRSGSRWNLVDGWPWNLHWHVDGFGSFDSGVERNRVPRPRSNLAILLPSSAHFDCCRCVQRSQTSKSETSNQIIHSMGERGPLAGTPFPFK
jgi:ribose/xylose/arabinose/galactoside ABC-type transport system permease subunit